MAPSPAQTRAGTAADELEGRVIDRLPEWTVVLPVHVGAGQADILQRALVETHETAARGAMVQPVRDPAGEIGEGAKPGTRADAWEVEKLSLHDTASVGVDAAEIVRLLRINPTNSFDRMHQQI